MNLIINENGNVVTGTLQGRLDTLAATQFAKDMEPLIEKADKSIVLDCSGLEFISSSGLRLLLTLRKAASEKAGSITLKGVSPSVKQVFTITGFNTLFDFE
ncbi:MAG: STAS domain-containing protein [Bacteroidales bacterium]|nr:STAS domain-containing protein [Bacteroidales bacterium]